MLEAPRRNARLRRSVVISGFCVCGGSFLCQASSNSSPFRRPFFTLQPTHAGLDCSRSRSRSHTPPFSHPVNCAINRCREGERAESPFLSILFAFRAPPPPTPFFLARLLLPLRKRFSSFRFIVTSRITRGMDPITEYGMYFLRRSYPNLNYPFRTLDRKQTYFLLKGKW